MRGGFLAEESEREKKFMDDSEGIDNDTKESLHKSTHERRPKKKKPAQFVS